LSLGIAVLMLSPPAHAAKGKVPPGSFLRQPIHSVQDLARTIKQDPVVAKRYSAHFGMSPAALADYFARCAWTKNLTHSHRYTVFYIAKNGKIVSRVRTVKAGSTVIVAWNGEPIMELRCGNPFLKRLPQPPTKVAEYKAETPPKKPEPPPKQEVVAPPEPEVTAPEAQQMVEVPAEAAPTTEVTPPIETKVLEAPPVALVPAEPPVVSPAQPAAVGAAKSTPNLLLPALIGAGAIGALSGGGGGGGGGGGSPIPEPAGLVAITIGAVGVFCRWYAIRRK